MNPDFYCGRVDGRAGQSEVLQEVLADLKTARTFCSTLMIDVLPLCVFFLSSASLTHNRLIFLKTNFSDEKRKFKEKFRHTMPLGGTMQQSCISFKNVAKSSKATLHMKCRSDMLVMFFFLNYI